MTKKKQLSTFLLALLFALDLCACGKRSAEKEAAIVPSSAEGSYMGYVPTEIPSPEEFGQIQDITLDGEILYIAGQQDTASRFEPVLGYYNTVDGAWQKIPYSVSASAGRIRGLSAKEGVLWAVAEENADGGNSIFRLLHFTLATGELNVQAIGFAAAEGGPGYGFDGIVALGADRAIVYDGQYSTVLDTQGNPLKTLSLEEGDLHCRMEHNGQLLARCTQNGQEGFRIFEENSLRFTDFIPLEAEALRAGVFTEAGAAVSSRCESERDRLLLCGNDGLYRFDSGQGQTELLSLWTDAALRIQNLYRTPDAVLETADGALFYCGSGNSLIQLSLAALKNRTELIFACYGTQYAYQDAILRYNNTNPDYKIRLVSYDKFKPGEQERFQMELTAGNTPDIIDTTLLSGAAADAGVLADLLPYIDSDPEYSREDFIQPLLAGMMRNGGLYELIPNVTVLSLAVNPDFYPGKDAWTADYIRTAEAAAPTFSARWNKEQLMDFFCLAAAAEFVDWQDGCCRFNSEVFKQWLSLVKEARLSVDMDEPVLLSPNYSATAGAYPYREELQGRYVLAGLPGASSPGYFLRLSSLPGEEADDISLGIVADSPHKEAAWEFLRIFLLPEYSSDIPLLQSSFEKRVESMIGRERWTPEDPGFYEQDAEKLRELVYSSDKVIRREAPLMEILKAETAAYLAGRQDLEEAAALIQSRASIYVAEQAG